MSETPEIHVKQTLFRRHMPDYRYLKPSSQGNPKLIIKDMDPHFFMEKPNIPFKYAGSVVSYGWDPYIKQVIMPRRNEPCPCMSGKKFKQCCLDKHN